MLKIIWKYIVFDAGLSVFCWRKLYLTIKKATRIWIYEQIVNENTLCNCFSITNIVGQNIILKKQTET